MTQADGLWWRVSVILASALVSSQVAATQSVPPPSGWIKYENLESVIGADGKEHTATCSGFPGTDPTFSFWAKRGTTNNLVVFFEGGGACWDNLTCSFPQSFVPAIDPDANPATYDGIFNSDNPVNPVKDWSFVYIPYCTGDLHVGSSTKKYFNVGNSALLRSRQTFAIQHRGFDNFMVVLDWIEQNFDAPNKVLVTGSSAGGYGASANFPWIQETYPNALVYVIADASQGVTTAAFDTGNPGRNSWNPQLAPWVFGTDLSAVPSPDLLRIAADAYPQTKTSQFTTVLDSTQIGFYGVMKLRYGPGGSCRKVAVDWNHQMLETLDAYAAEVDNFRFYLADGDYHTIMGSPRFYEEQSAGIPYVDWVGAMLQSQSSTGGEKWQDTACPTCLDPLPCR